MKRTYASVLCGAVALGACAQYASQNFVPVKVTDRTLFFSTAAQGKKLPILWGLDTAWPDEANMIRGVRYIGVPNIGVARVSFQPWDWMLSGTTLTKRLEDNLAERLRLVSYIGGPDHVQLVLNNDAPDDKYDKRYSDAATNADACTAYCNLIYGTLLSCQQRGWTVVTASPLNEPDYVWNLQGSKDDFLAIAKKLKTEYPQFKDGKIRISGGNTLNCDQATPWYSYLYDYIDEGNTHQLAGDFDHYADFFARVRADGKYATADELHNVMEAMVGVEYGMQTGIWWGTAEHTRGEFCRASFGERLAYVENRKAWTAAAVYRSPEGKTQAFVGSSERQANVCSYRFVSQDRDVFYNGHGPQREFVVDMPGAEGYQQGQTNAECVVDITWGEDVAPVIDGRYQIMNKKSKKLLAVKGAPANASAVKQYATAMASVRTWDITPVPSTIGGDFSYFTICASDSKYQLDVNNWSLNEGGDIIIYDGVIGHNEQWFFKYAGDGYFRIFSRHSGLCLQLAEERDADGVAIVQAAPSESPAQLWRLIAPAAICETVLPEAPASLTAEARGASIYLNWEASASTDVVQYVVLRADATDGEFNTIARLSGITEFVDNTVAVGRQYAYKVKAVDRACNSSACTAIVNATTLAGSHLIGRWLFDQDLADQSDNHFDAAAYTGARVMYGDGHASQGNSLRLSTARFVQLPYQVADHDAITVSAWINWQVKGGVQTIFDFGSDTAHYAALRVTPTGSLEFAVNAGDAESTVTGGGIKAKEWQHVAVTVSRQQASLYIDGVLVAQGPVAANLSDLNPVLNYIGTAQERAGNYIDACIDDFSVYNCALPPSLVPQLMTGVVDVSGIDSIVADDTVIVTEYYNLMGVRVQHPADGVYVVRKVSADGRCVTFKQRF